MQFGGITRRRRLGFAVGQDCGHPALGPLGGRVGEGALERTPILIPELFEAPLTAADKPATPLPTIRRSRSVTVLNL